MPFVIHPEYLPTIPTAAETAELDQLRARLTLDTASEVIRITFDRLDPAGRRVLADAMKDATEGQL